AEAFFRKEATSLASSFALSRSFLRSTFDFRVGLSACDSAIASPIMKGATKNASDDAAKVAAIKRLIRLEDNIGRLLSTLRHGEFQCRYFYSHRRIASTT